jgi:adenosylhomocysteine nucleosidase
LNELAKTVVVLVSAGAEWRGVLEVFPNFTCQASPYGDWFERPQKSSPPALLNGPTSPRVIFLHGGWGKIAAAASTEYAIQRWQPELLINLGTCGGFAGRVQRGEILLVEETLVYDIIEQMGDPQAALNRYATRLDLTWLPAELPQVVRRARLVSADRDLSPQDIPMLIERYEAVAADWESGAIAWVAARRGVRCLILRGVSDLVSVEGGESLEIYRQAARQIMHSLIGSLDAWIGASRLTSTPG